MSGILQIPAGAAASVSHHKSIVTESYQINSCGASSLVIRDLQVSFHLVEPDLRGLVVELVRLPPVEVHLHRTVKGLTNKTCGFLRFMHN